MKTDREHSTVDDASSYSGRNEEDRVALRLLINQDAINVSAEASSLAAANTPSSLSRPGGTSTTISP